MPLQILLLKTSIKVDSEVIRRVLFLEYLLRTAIVTKNQ